MGCHYNISFSGEELDDETEFRKMDVMISKNGIRKDGVEIRVMQGRIKGANEFF